MTCNEPATFVDVLSSTLIPESLHQVCLTSLKLIENASSNQVSAAVEYNQNKLNVILIQLLTINFISQNKKQIENDIVQFSQANSTYEQSETSSVVDVDLEEYCEHKLLSLSPILGFSRKNYFIEHNISNDIRMEIISYLKPIEIFKNITLTNKILNENVQTMHQSYQYANVFCNKHYMFESFTKMKKYCENSDNDNKDMDWRFPDGAWVCGQVDSIDPKEMEVYVSAMIGDKVVTQMVGYLHVSPTCTMSFRPGNEHRFVNILKRGYCSETCDVNLKNFYVCTEDGRYPNVVSGYDDDDDEDENENESDIWRCGWIDFDWTWTEAIERNEAMFGVEKQKQTDEIAENKHALKNKKILENSDKNNEERKTETEAKNEENDTKNKNKNKNKNFRMFQVRVNVDITEEYNKLDGLIRRKIHQFFPLQQTREDRWIISFVFHIDDIDNFTYFGSKTTLTQQLKLKKYLFNKKFKGYDSGGINRSKAKLLDAVNYPNYCAVTPNGVFNAMSDNVEERKQFNKWYTIAKGTIREAECVNIAISDNAVNKVYYDKKNDQLSVKLLPWFRWILDDSNAPIPLEKRYIIPHGNECRLIEGKIVDPGLIDKVKMENIKDSNKKQERYFELLREWKGYIIISVDITDEFDQFQERIKDKYIEYHGNNNSKAIEWDNRKYFLNTDEMRYLKWNKKEDKITRDVYILLDSKRVYNFDAKFNFFDILTPRDAQRVLENIFAYAHPHDSFDNTLALVCKDWHRFEQDRLPRRI